MKSPASRLLPSEPFVLYRKHTGSVGDGFAGEGGRGRREFTDVLRDGFVTGGEFDEGRFAPGAAEDFEADGIAVGGEAHGHDERGQAGDGAQLVGGVFAFGVVAGTDHEGLAELVRVDERIELV